MSFQRRQLLRALSFALGTNFISSRNGLGLAAQTAPTSLPPSAAAATEMEKVTGIGGLFFRAHDPGALGLWYQQHLGVSLAPSSNQHSVWQQAGGPTVFSPFPETSNYFGNPDKVWMVNFRVRDIEKMVAQLRGAGIEVKLDPTSSSIGRFARLHDPEGNPIELWQPATPGSPQ
jgi:glyoxylase I family protein